jgi:hypothetical protein
MLRLLAQAGCAGISADVACREMEYALSTPAVVADATAVSEVVARRESPLYGQTSFSQIDLQDK